MEFSSQLSLNIRGGGGGGGGWKDEICFDATD